MITIFTGLPGASKSYFCAQTTMFLLNRNERWYKATGQRRMVMTNLAMHPKVEKRYGFGTERSFLGYWEDPEEIPKMKNIDLVWEEMGAHVDSRGWENLPLELRRFLQQHRHRGVEIYGNCQDYNDIDVAIRRITGNLVHLTKIVGSRDPSPTTKPPRFIWGVVMIHLLNPRPAIDEDERWRTRQFHGFEFINREGVELYSMHNDIKAGKYPPLQHRNRECPDCGYKKITHV